VIAIAVCAAGGLPDSVRAQTRASRSDVPPGLLGAFVDDYGIRYMVSEQLWGQGTTAHFEIVEWNVSDQFLLARNAEANPTEAGLWTRVDWVWLVTEPEAPVEYAWAFCYAVYDAESESAARAADPSGRDTPMTGCNGFPFSRMKRT